MRRLKRFVKDEVQEAFNSFRYVEADWDKKSKKQLPKTLTEKSVEFMNSFKHVNIDYKPKRRRRF